MGDGPPIGAICCGICCCAGLITLIIILATSFHTLDQLELGLNYNSITLQVEDTVYTTAGFFFLGPGHWFIRCACARAFAAARGASPPRCSLCPLNHS